MNVGKTLGLTACLVVLAVTGCSQTQSSIVRAQSPTTQSNPDLSGPILGTAPGYAQQPHIGHRHHDFKVLFNQEHKPLGQYYNPTLGHEDGAYDGREQFYDDHRKVVYDDDGGHGCPACNGGMSCPPDGCQYCGYGCQKGCPKHYHTYQYNWPRNLVYPSNVLPAGMVQYPYYTLRGPTDFFMK